MTDLFEEMRRKVGCTYISDLPQNRDALFRELDTIDLNSYPKHIIVDFLQYVFCVR